MKPEMGSSKICFCTSFAITSNETRKVGATEYWDDKAYRVQNGKLMKEVAHEMD